MITPRPASSEFDDDKDASCTASSISDIQFWIDHPSLDDLTAAQTESERQQVRRDVEECIRLLMIPKRPFDAKENGIDSDATTQHSQYKVINVLGVGGFGVVLHTTDRTLNRDVAVKILRPSILLSKHARARFSVEGEALARCNCQGIVPVHEVGDIDGHPYLVMGLVNGATLADNIRSQPIPVAPTVAARIVAEVAQAVHQAHQLGILHRDLKPSNVLLQQGVESRLGLPFTPFVSDFGLAKDLLPGSRHDHSHASIDSPIIGTVRYMSPEQATGRGQDVSVTSDVFSLGVILYELLTLECPFKGATTFETIQQVATASPKSPRQLNPRVSRDLNAIVGRCMAKLPDERYQSAGDLADDLHRFLEGKPVMAKPAGPIKATLFWAKRNPSLAVAVSIIWCGLLVSTIAISLLYRLAREATIREDLSRQFALTAIDNTLRYTAEETLKNVPQSEKKKLDLHLRALKNNQAYAELRGHDEESLYRLSIAHHYVANDAFNCQQFDLSSFHRNRCLEIVVDLAEKDPKNCDYQFDLFMNRYLTPAGTRSGQEHLDWLLKTREHLQAAIRLSPYNPDYEECDAAICVTIGQAIYNCKQGKPREWFAIAINKLPELGKRYPERPHYYKHAIAGHHGMALIGIDERKWEFARDHCVLSLDLIEKHFRRSKDIADIHISMLTTLDYYAQALQHLDQSKAIEVYGQYIAESFEIEKLEPRFQFYQMRRGGAYFDQARMHHQLGDRASCETAIAKAMQTLESYKPLLPSDAAELSMLRSKMAEFEKDRSL